MQRDERECPFCTAPVQRRTVTAGLAAVVIGLGMSVVSCGAEVDDGGSGGSSGTSTSTSKTTSSGAGGAVAAYGPAPFDGGTAGAGGSTSSSGDGGGIAPAYGPPPPQDAG